MFPSTLERERERGRLISGGWTAQTKLNAVTANYSSETAMETTGHSRSYIRTANAQATLIFIACDLVWWRWYLPALSGGVDISCLVWWRWYLPALSGGVDISCLVWWRWYLLSCLVALISPCLVWWRWYLLPCLVALISSCLVWWRWYLLPCLVALISPALSGGVDISCLVWCCWYLPALSGVAGNSLPCLVALVSPILRLVALLSPQPCVVALVSPCPSVGVGVPSTPSGGVGISVICLVALVSPYLFWWRWANMGNAQCKLKAIYLYGSRLSEQWRISHRKAVV